MPRSRLAIDISSDLVFADPDLEEKYRKQHVEAQVRFLVGCSLPILPIITHNTSTSFFPINLRLSHRSALLTYNFTTHVV